MTTSHSPLRVLKAQADKIAYTIKAVERGENPIEDRGGKIAASRNKEAIKVGVVMDDKVLTIDITWATIRASSEVGLAEFILKHMRGSRDAVH